MLLPAPRVAAQVLNHHRGYPADKHFVIDNQDYGHHVLLCRGNRCWGAKAVHTGNTDTDVLKDETCIDRFKVSNIVNFDG